MEPNVIIRSRKQDATLVQNVISKAVEKYSALASKDCNVHLDQENWLSQDMTGGVEIHAQTGRIKVIMIFFHTHIFFLVLINIYIRW